MEANTFMWLSRGGALLSLYGNMLMFTEDATALNLASSFSLWMVLVTLPLSYFGFFHNFDKSKVKDK